MKLLNEVHDPKFGCFIHKEIQFQKGLEEEELQATPPDSKQKHWSGKSDIHCSPSLQPAAEAPGGI